jgi:enoyl-[acyl-carrier protein] reductase I
MINLNGKRAIVFGVADESSIAWAISKWLAEAGATIVLSYQKRFRSRIFGLTKDIPWIENIYECDVAEDEQVKNFFNGLEGKFDILIHAIGYAPATALSKPVMFTTEEDYNTAMVISAYSLQRIVRHSLRVLNPNSSVVTLTYLGGVKVVPGYRIMGVAKAALEAFVRELSVDIGSIGHRINAISSGPIKTLAASNVPGFDNILGFMENAAPLKRNVTQDDVAKTCLFLSSDLSSGISGQIIYVDAGFSSVALPSDIDKITFS